MPIHSRLLDEEFTKKFMDIIFSMEWKDYEDYVENYSLASNPKAAVTVTVWGIYLEGIGVLVKRGLIDASFVDDLMSGHILRYWEKIGPVIKKRREELNWPQYFEHVEYLYNKIKPIVEEQHPELKT